MRGLAGEYFLGVGHALRSGRFHVFERVVDAELLVFGQRQCVVGEDFDALHVAKRVDEFAGLGERGVVVADAGNENVPYPDGLWISSR